MVAIEIWPAKFETFGTHRPDILYGALVFVSTDERFYERHTLVMPVASNYVEHRRLIRCYFGCRVAIPEISMNETRLDPPISTLQRRQKTGYYYLEWWRCQHLQIWA